MSFFSYGIIATVKLATTDVHVLGDLKVGFGLAVGRRRQFNG
jgi:hypothetical protein